MSDDVICYIILLLSELKLIDIQSTIQSRHINVFISLHYRLHFTVPIACELPISNGLFVVVLLM